MATLLWDVQAALATVFAAAVTPTDVFSGPRPRTGSAPRTFLLIGADGGDTGVNDGLSDDGLRANQVPSPMGNNWRDETGAILCAAWAWSGDTPLGPLRTDVQQLFDACAGALRADRTLDGVLGAAGIAQMSGIAIRETQTQKGPFVRAGFTVTYQAVITT